jgi:hypothetical protein
MPRCRTVLRRVLGLTGATPAPGLVAIRRPAAFHRPPAAFRRPPAAMRAPVRCTAAAIPGTAATGLRPGPGPAGATS